MQELGGSYSKLGNVSLHGILKQSVQGPRYAYIYTQDHASMCICIDSQTHSVCWYSQAIHVIIYLGVSKNRGKTPKMDGLYWKTLSKMDDLGIPLFSKTSI